MPSVGGGLEITMIYTVTFNPALDYVIGVNHFQTGTLNRTSYESITYGGKGINVSCILSRLDIPNIALGFIAGFTGLEIEAQVKSEGIHTDFICLKEGLSRINVKMKSDDETEINGQGPKIQDTDLSELFQKMNALKDEDYLVLAGSIPTTLPSDIYEQILMRIKNKDIRVIVDATKDLLLNVLPFHPFLIKPNHHELGELFGITLTKEEDIIHYAKELQKLGARNVLVSMASKGSLFIDEAGNIIRMGVPNGTVVNSVGAGDSMIGGFLAGYLTTGSYYDALRLGTAAGSATAFSIGIGSRKLIDSLLLQF